MIIIHISHKHHSYCLSHVNLEMINASTRTLMSDFNHQSYRSTNQLKEKNNQHQRYNGMVEINLDPLAEENMKS